MTKPDTPAPSGAAPAGYEHQKAIQEGERIGASDAYFAARHDMLDTRDRRNVFDAGFDRGYAAALKSREASAPLTIDQIDAVIRSVPPRGNPIYDMNHLRELVRAAAALASPQVAPVPGQRLADPTTLEDALHRLHKLEDALAMARNTIEWRGRRIQELSAQSLAAPVQVAPAPQQPSMQTNPFPLGTFGSKQWSKGWKDAQGGRERPAHPYFEGYAAGLACLPSKTEGATQ